MDIAPTATLRSRKLSEIVAESLITEIKERGWPTGESIGTEADLIQRFKVSRATIVEATRQIESQGAAIMKRGSNGGLFVLGSGKTAAARVIALYLELIGVSIAEQYEVARILETESVRRASLFSSEENCAHLRELAEGVSQAIDDRDFHPRAMRLRFAIAESGGNPALELLLRALARVITSYVRPDLRSGLRDLRFEHLVASDMIAIVEAISARDAVLGDNYARQDIERRETRARILAVTNADLSSGPLSRTSPAKLAEQVALAIRDDIAGNGWRTGERLAHEAQLPERYGASQWTMRQAIRILELHGIIDARRGQGGGLFVGRPSADYTVAAVINFVGEDVFPLTGVTELRKRVFESIAQFAAIRGTRTEFGELERIAGPGARFDEETILNQFMAMAHNRVLGVYALILNRRIAASSPARGRGEDLLTVVEAVRLRDGPLARRRISAYFSASGPENTLRNSDA